MATAIPSLVDGNVLSGSEWDTLTTLNDQVGCYAITTPLAGASPGVTAPNFMIVAGSSAVTLSSGLSSISYPTAFPNGVVTVVVSNGDAVAVPNLVLSTYSTPTKTAFTVQGVTGNTGSLFNGTCRVNWLAVGF